MIYPRGKSRAITHQQSFMDLFRETEQSLLRKIRSHPDFNFQFNFSGGKDSSAIVGLLLSLINRKELKDSELSRIIIYHSDTTIESPLFVNTTKKILGEFKSKGLRVIVRRAEIEKRFFAQLFGYGKPVPNHAVRWCTDNLKIKIAESVARELGQKTIIVTGEHIGESRKRDKKIGCGSSECGSDKLKSKKLKKSELMVYRAIENWRSCQVWEYLAELDYSGVIGFYNEIANVYEISNDDDTNKSLRMGCIGCPVISIKNHYDTERKGIPNSLSLRLSLLYEEMRSNDIRLRDPRYYNKETEVFEKGYGAIAIEARKFYWETMKKLNNDFLSAGITLISREEEEFIESCLEKRQYPVTYHRKKDMIDILEREWENRKPKFI